MAVRYHSVALLLAYFSELSPMRVAPRLPDVEPFLGRSPLKFVKSVTQYRQTLLGREQEFHKHNSKFATEPPQDPSIPSFLYNPIVAPAFGAPDSIGLALLDDIDLVSTIGIKTNCSRFKSSVAFCPTAESLRTSVAGTLEHHERPHLDCIKCPLELFDGELVDPSSLTSTEKFSLLNRGLAPLMMVSEISLSGLASLTRTGEAIDHVSCVVARTLVQAVATMSREEGQLNLGFLICESLSDSDLILISMGDNINQLATAIMAIRSLTFDAYKPFPKLSKSFEGSDATNSIQKLFQRAKGNEAEEERTLRFSLLSTQVVGSTNSCIAVSQEVTRPGYGSSLGLVRANTAVAVSCGHIADVDSKYKAVADKIKSGSAHRKEVDRLAWPMSFSIGAADYHIEWSEVPEDEGASLKCMSLNAFLGLVRDSYYGLGTMDARKQVDGFRGFPQHHETGVLSLNTALKVPIRDYMWRYWIERPSHELSTDIKRIELIPLFDHIGRSCVIDSSHKNINPEHTYDSSVMDLEMLRWALKRIGLPRTLRRSILSAFEMFGEILSDYQAAHHILDLYDAFATFYRLICNDMQVLLASLENADEIYTFADDGVVTEIHIYIDAIWRSLRGRFNYLNGDQRDFEFHFGWQTNLQKFVHAADAVLKCGIGIRRAIDQGTTRSHVASLLELSDHPRTVITRGKLPESVRLAIVTKGIPEIGSIRVPMLSRVRLDFSSLFSCFSYVRCLHEAIHLIGEMIYLDALSPSNHRASTAKRQSVEGKTGAEFFVSVMMRLLLFENDSDSFHKYSFAALSLAPAANTKHPEELRMLAIRQLVNVVVSDVVCTLVGATEQEVGSNPRSRRFRQVRLSGPQESQFQLAFAASFESAFAALNKLFCRSYLFREDLEEQGFSTRRFCRECVLTEIESSWDNICDEILPAIKSLDQFFETGRHRPLPESVRIAFASRSPALVFDCFAEFGGDRSCDELLVICSAIAVQISQLLDDKNIDGRAIVNRELDGRAFTGAISFSGKHRHFPSTQKWAAAQIDPISSGVRCAESRMRQFKLGGEIVMARAALAVANSTASRRLQLLVDQIEGFEEATDRTSSIVRANEEK